MRDDLAGALHDPVQGRSGLVRTNRPSSLRRAFAGGGKPLSPGHAAACFP